MSLKMRVIVYVLWGAVYPGIVLLREWYLKGTVLSAIDWGFYGWIGLVGVIAAIIEIDNLIRKK